MRKPSEYVAAAKARLRDGLIPDCSEVFRHGERVAKVTRIGSPSVGEEPLLGEEPAENCRVLAMVADFPALARGEAVELGETFRVVTSCRKDIAEAGYTVGLSAAFDKCKAAYSGTRRESGAVRNIRHPLDVLALESGGMYESLDSVASAAETTWTVAIRRADWPETTDPQISDSLSLGCDGQSASNLSLTVAAVSRHDGWYILKCRTRGGRNG